MAHTYNHSYSGGRDQEDHSLKQAQAKSLWDHITKNPITTNSAGGVTQVKSLSSSLSATKKKKKKKREVI
jgi:hypothetical protein